MNAPAAPLTAPPAKPSRSKVEFWIVRGGMLLLVLLVGMQAHARFGYEWTLKKLQAKMAAGEDAEHELLLSDAQRCVVGWPSRSTEEDRHWRKLTLSWRGLTQSYRIHLPYDGSEQSPAILGVQTDNPPAEPEPTPPAEATADAGGAHGGPGMPMMGGPGGGMGGPGGGMAMGGPGGGPGGGGPRPDIMTNDADGDGKVSLEEAPERMRQWFGRMDTNSDGFIDADEAASARARRGAGGGPGGGRPPAEGEERPATVESTEAADAAAAVKEIATPAEPAPATETPATATDAPAPDTSKPE
jgi:hypothetical protein